MMKKTISVLLALALTLSLTVTAFAYSEYGLLYDATDLLDPEIAQNAEEQLVALTERFGIEFRVDVVTDLEGREIYDYAELFYDQFEYGYGEARDGVLLMLQLAPDESGLFLANVQLYCGGTNADYLWGFSDLADANAGIYLTEEAWSGPLGADNTTFADLLTAYTDAAAGYFSGELSMEPGAPIGGEGPQSDPSGTAAPEDGPLDYITDAAGILSDEEWWELESRAQALSELYHCGVYAIIVDDYREYGFSAEDACKTIHREYALNDEAIVLLLSMDDRDYNLTDFGSKLEKGLTSYGRDTLESSFLDNFRNNDWYGGFSDYLVQSAVLLEAAANGTPLDKPLSERAPKAYGIALVVGLVAAFVTCAVFKAQMKTAVKATSAEEYVAPAGVDMRIREDRYTHTTKTQRRIEKSSGSSGGGRSRSGKF